ncbi:MAG: glycosyltransferase [Sphingomonas sp.]
MQAGFHDVGQKWSKGSYENAELRKALVEMDLFDRDWYVAKYPDVTAYGGEPLDHFLRLGAKLGRSPHPLFDAQWYLQQNPDVAQADITPFWHYIRHGAAEGRDPSPYFSSSFYVANNPAVAAQRANPLAHFVAQWTGKWGVESRKAAVEQRDFQLNDPHPLFNMRWYLSQYGDQIPSGANPLTFHVTTGHRRDYDPHPLIDCRWYRRANPQRAASPCILRDYLALPWEDVRCPSPLFDRQWYFETYRQHLDGVVDPLIDYVTVGQRAGRIPHPMFASDWYVRQNDNAALYPGGPLCHFREVGGPRGTDPHPMFSTRFLLERHPEARQDPCGPVAHYLLADKVDPLQPHPLFDSRWYLACNPEAREAPVAPLVHLLGYGISECRDPHPLFDSNWYLQTYPHARKALVHPLAHYLETGSVLNYWPTNFFDPDFYALQYPESGGIDPLIHFALWGMLAGNLPNADAEARLSGPLAPDVYNAGPMTFSRYVRAVGYTARIVLACDAVKNDPVAYDYYLACLAAESVRWALPAEMPERPLVSVVLPTYNGLHFTMASIASVGRFLPDVPFELIVADNVSSDQTETVLKDRKDIRYIRHPENLGFLRSCNRAARFARGDFIFLLNNDTLVAPGWLDELYTLFCLHDNVGLVGSKLIYPDGRLQEAGGIIWQDGSAWNYGKFQDPGRPEFNYVRETDYCSGAAIMLPKRLWDEVGGFDEMYVPSYCEDSDLALRVRSLGYSVLYSPLSVVAHFEGMTQGRDTSSGIKAYQISNTEKLLARWRPIISQYQPNGQQLDLAKDRDYFKRALFIDECTPAPKEDAGSVTAINLMRLLQSRGYIVTFVPRSNYLYVNELSQDLQRSGIETIYGRYVNSVEDHLSQHGKRYDVIVMMRPQSFEHHIEAVRRDAPQAKLIYHTCDLHYLRLGREADLTGNAEAREMAKRFKLIEHGALTAADASIVHSTTEFDMLRTDLPTLNNVRVFGWAIPVKNATLPFEHRSGAIFVGGFNHMPNVDAVLFFVNEVLPIVWQSHPELVFHVVGSKTPEAIRALASDRVVVHGFVDNLEPLFEHVQMAVAPLRYGAGIKGKIATAMSVGLPNVVTTIGAEGMGLTDRQNCLIADSPEDLARAVCELAEDKGLWTRMALASAAFCEENYGVTAAERIFEDILVTSGAESGEVRPVKLVSPTGSEAPGTWPRQLQPIAVLREAADATRLSASSAMARIRIRDRYARARLHDRPETGYPAYSTTAGTRLIMNAGNVALEETGGSLRNAIICPVSNLANLDRLLATLMMKAMPGQHNGLLYVASVGSEPLQKWIWASLGEAVHDQPADLIISDDYDVALDRLVLPGGRLIAVAASLSSGLGIVGRLRRTGWTDASLEIYHSPDYGHLGTDLLILRAIR